MKLVSRHTWLHFKFYLKQRKRNLEAITVLKKEGGVGGEVQRGMIMITDSIFVFFVYPKQCIQVDISKHIALPESKNFNYDTFH